MKIDARVRTCLCALDRRRPTSSSHAELEMCFRHPKSTLKVFGGVARPKQQKHKDRHDAQDHLAALLMGVLGLALESSKAWRTG